MVAQGGEELDSAGKQGAVWLLEFLCIVAALPVPVDIVSQHEDKIEPPFPVTIEHLAGNSILWVFPRSTVSDHGETELAACGFLKGANSGRSRSPPGHHDC